MEQLHILELLLQLGNQFSQLDGALLLSLHHVGGGLIHKAGVAQLGIQLLQLGGVLLQLLLHADLFLCQIHQLSQGDAALGHIHRAQKIGAEKNHYPGTIFPYSVSEADEQKFVTMVELGAKGDAPQLIKLPLDLPRQVRRLRGTMEEVLTLAGDTMCHDYVSITLTDEVEASYPREILEEKYDHILEIRIDNARTRKLIELGDIEMENLAPYEAFCNFFAELNGREMTEAEDALLKEVLREGGDME